MALSDPAALLNSAAIRLKDARKYYAALTAIRRAVAIDPRSHELQGSLGAILWNCGEYEGAKQALLNAIAGNDLNATYWAHIGLCYASLQEWEKAGQAYDIALELAPENNLPLRWNKSQFLLASGQFDEGFKEYESRIAFRGPPLYPKWPYLMWEGQDLDNKTIVVFGEQGVGDSVLSSRYLDALKAKYPTVRILWFIQPRLHDLFWGFRDIAEFWPAGHPWPEADYGIFQMGLLRWFRDIPDDTGRIRRRAELQAGSIRLNEPRLPSLKIGIAWTGNPAMGSNEDRSMPIEAFLRLAENPNCTLYSLQVGSGENDIQFVGCDDLIKDHSTDLSVYGFAGTAALMLNLDLVITVCTSNAHLAGALGVPCWTLLSYDPYWVWGRRTDTSPYYPSMKLFRQPAPGDWQSVMDKVEAALAVLVEQKQLQH